jgi:zinc transporter, ZIP family
MREALAGLDLVTLGFLGSLAAGLMTAVGALPVLAGRTMSRQMRDAMLGFAAGVMLSASFFSLILPAIAAVEAPGRWVAPAVVSAGIVLGAVAVAALNAALPHEHFLKGREGPAAERLTRIWLFVFAITIHNFPEGMAVGIGFAGGNLAAGTALAIGIGLQNAPEGLAVALALRGEGYSRARSFGVAALTGMIEPVGGLLGAWALSLAAALLPWGLAFAAGAMIYVISHEIIPETHRQGHGAGATWGLVAGLVVMLMLDVGLG